MATKTFAYEALDSTGAAIKGSLESESTEAAAQALLSQKLVPLSVTTAGQGLQREIKIPGLGGRTTLKDLAIMSRQFASMMSAGLPLLRALSILDEQTSKPKLQAAISRVRSEVQGGVTLSTAMGRHPDQFPLLMVNMVRAGEAGGFLDGALDRIASMYEADANLRAKIKGAMTYPVIVLMFSLILGMGVIIFIVPIFERMFADLGGELPLPTKVMVILSNNLWWVAPLAIVAAVVGLKYFRDAYRKNPAFRLRVDRIKLRLPVMGKLSAKLAISRWARTLGTLLHVGVPMLQALEVVGGTSGNAVITQAMKEVMDEVRAGNQMSGPLSRHPLFPTMVVQMMEVGEETGQITEMLDKVADFYDHEVEAATDSLTAAMEPLLVVLMGVVIGSMVVCLYLPMFSIYQNIQS
ncbi:type II secretion system F family protein [Rhodococcus sp. X156]|uniref:type II secretion system F family protein n=1 Tax=Rhodococcus sp. X156 TaxID=2499145 RepID=UPI000FDC570E|nr:type II secretion system F family protein [Rhodococcus sp. X156]